jgi:Fe-S cluster assembly ATPase SufC
MWGPTSPARRALLKSMVAVMFDGKTILSGTIATYPTAKDQVVIGRNSIGASTSEPVFSGIMRYSERTGTFVPPGLKL